MVLCFVPDLMDRSRISAACADVEFTSDLAALAQTDASLVVVDVSRPGVLGAVGGLSSRVIGFAPHVDVELIEQGRAAGVEVLPRSRFFAGLPGLLERG